jgi:GDPmannose 4,6-dehydratase
MGDNGIPTMKSAVITGIAGQDGAYLARLLLDKGYEVHGTLRRDGSTDLWRLDSLGVRHHPRLHLLQHDLASLADCLALMDRLRPQEVYHLAAQSSVAKSFEEPHATVHGIQQANLNLLEAIRQVTPTTRFFEAGTSEMFSDKYSMVCSELTPLHPRSPYGLAKLNTYWTTVNYRESFQVFGAVGILFNHESPLRDPHFVTRKITRAAARIALGKQTTLELGNLEARRDWGYAADYVDGMWRMMQAEEPETFVLATQRTDSVRDFVQLAFASAGISVEFQGQAEYEVAVVTGILNNCMDLPSKVNIGQIVVKVNPDYFRPIENGPSIGDPSKSKLQLGWEATTTLEQLCQMMVTADLARVMKE